MLYMIGVKFELILDIDMYQFAGKQMRSDVSYPLQITTSVWSHMMLINYQSI